MSRASSVVSSLGIAIAIACRTRDGDVDVRAAAPPKPPAQYDLGTPVDSARLKMIDIDVNPAGTTTLGTNTKKVLICGAPFWST